MVIALIAFLKFKKIKQNRGKEKMSQFPSAISYYKANGNTLLGISAQKDDPQQPDVDFAFGALPENTRGMGAGKNIGFIGGGDVYAKFVRPAMEQRGGTHHIADPNKTAHIEAALAGAHGPNINYTTTFNEVAVALDHVFVLTPPGLHMHYVEKAIKKGVPFIVEKPLVANVQQLAEMERLIAAGGVSSFFLDWQIEHAKPLYVAALKKQEIPVPLNDVVKIEDPKNFFAEFDIQNVVQIDARFVEGGNNPLQEVDGTATGRGWLKDFKQGGGLLYDMAVHPLNTLAVLGFNQTSVKDVILARKTKTPGHFERFGSDSPDEGEGYGRAIITMGIDGGRQDIPAVIEAAKNGSANDGMIRLKDKNGLTLEWEMFPGGVGGSRVELKNRFGRVLAFASMTADCYALAIEHADRVFAAGEPVALYFKEQAAVFRAISEMHVKARSTPVAANEIIRQLKLEEQGLHSNLVSADFDETAKLQAAL